MSEVQQNKKGISNVLIIGLVILGLVVVVGIIVGIFFGVKGKSPNKGASGASGPPGPSPPGPSPPGPPTGPTGPSPPSPRPPPGLTLPPANLFLCYAQANNPFRSRIKVSGLDKCTISAGFSNIFTISVWSNKPLNSPLVKYNVWNNTSSTNSDYYVLPDSNKTITSSTSGWNLETAFFALQNDVSSNLSLEKYNVYSPSETSQRSIITKGSDTSSDLFFRFSFYSPKTLSVPPSTLSLCYADTQDPDNLYRSYVYYGDNICAGNASGWTRRFKIPVYSTANALTTEYIVWKTNNFRERTIITRSDDSPGTGWEQVGKFYAYSEPYPETFRYCVMDSSDPVRSVIYINDDCTDKFGWRSRTTFFGPKV